MKKIIILFFLSLCFVFAKPKVAVAIPPLDYIIQTITEKRFLVHSLYSENYLTEVISRKEVREITKNLVYLTLNLPKEKEPIKYLKAISKIDIVDVSKGITKIDNNPYVWTDPLNFRVIVLNVYEEIIKLDTTNQEIYSKNLDKLLSEIDEIFLNTKKDIFTLENYNLYVFDEFWEYYAKRYRLNLFKRDKTYFDAKEIYETILFTREKSIKKLLIDPNDEQKLITFFTSNSETTAIKNNIFTRNWEASINQLTKDIIEK